MLHPASALAEPEGETRFKGDCDRALLASRQAVPRWPEGETRFKGDCDGMPLACHLLLLSKPEGETRFKGDCDFFTMLIASSLAGAGR